MPCLMACREISVPQILSNSGQTVTHPDKPAPWRMTNHANITLTIPLLILRRSPRHSPFPNAAFHSIHSNCPDASHPTFRSPRPHAIITLVDRRSKRKRIRNENWRIRKCIGKWRIGGRRAQRRKLFQILDKLQQRQRMVIVKKIDSRYCQP